VSPDAARKCRIPEGWSRFRRSKITKEEQEKTKEIGPIFVSQCWEPMDFAVDSDLIISDLEKYKEKLSLSPEYRPIDILPASRRAKLLGLSIANMRRFLKPAILRDGRLVRNPWDIVKIYRPIGKLVWLPIEFVFGKRKYNESGARLCIDESGDVEPIRLGRVTVWDETSDVSRLVHIAGERAVKVFRDGIGVGPPAFF
jgi:hypothetical protein